MDYFIGEDKFRVFLPDVQFIEKSDDDSHNSRQILGIMSSQSQDRQGEKVISKGLNFNDFMQHGHFNDNHSQETSAVVGYPEKITYHEDLSEFNPKLSGIEGWTCKGYILKGTKRADGIWELAKALGQTPDRRLGFSIEGKVERRIDKTIKSARIRNLAITNSPVNTDAQWNILEKSFYDRDIAEKAMTAGTATTPQAQSNGGALRSESLDSDVKEIRKKREKLLERALMFDDLVKAMDFVLEKRPDFDDEAAAYFITHLFKGGRI